MWKPANFKKLMLVLFVALLAQCGGKKSRSAEASTWLVLPKEPIVILGDVKDSNGNEIRGPWFSFRLAMSNDDGADSITVVNVEITVTATDKTGMPEIKTFSLSPSDFNHSYKSNDDEIQCKYFSFGTFAKGVKEQPFTLTMGSDANCTVIPMFYLGGFAKKTTGAQYRYKVKARPLGWFGPFDDPKDRYDMSFTFNTK